MLQDHALGANETILDEAKDNSPGFDAYQDGLDRDIFVKDWNNSKPLYAEVSSSLISTDFSKDHYFKSVYDMYDNFNSDMAPV